jgi:hypothetical protein
MIRTRHLSPLNVLLVYMQRPGSNAVFSKRQWEKLNREVAPDAIPIVILRPFGPVSFVFDLADTTGPKLPGEHYIDVSKVLGRSRSLSWDRVTKSARRFGIEVELTSHYGAHRDGTAARLVSTRRILERVERTTNAIPSNRKAKSDYQGDLDVFWRIRINRRLPDEARLAVLTHELGHIYCGHLGPGPWGVWTDRSRSLTGPQKEIEAEAASFLSCLRTGLMPASERYIAQYLTEENIAAISIPVIVQAMQRIESG